MGKHTEPSAQELLEEYPFLAVPWDKGLCWFDSIPTGWRKSFGIQMADELKDLLLRASKIDGTDWLHNYEVSEVKEKWGALRWYADVPMCLHQEFETWERKYEELSMETCIVCGKPAEGRTKGWITPICEECARKHNLPFVPDEEDEKDGEKR